MQTTSTFIFFYKKHNCHQNFSPIDVITIPISHSRKLKLRGKQEQSTKLLNWKFGKQCKALLFQVFNSFHSNNRPFQMPIYLCKSLSYNILNRSCGSSLSLTLLLSMSMCQILSTVCKTHRESNYFMKKHSKCNYKFNQKSVQAQESCLQTMSVFNIKILNVILSNAFV